MSAPIMFSPSLSCHLIEGEGFIAQMILGAELSEALIYWYDKQVSGDEPD